MHATTTGLYWPRTKKKKNNFRKRESVDSGLIGRPAPGKKRMLLTRRWETASVNGAIVNRGVPSWINGLHRRDFRDRQSSETWPFCAGFYRSAPGKRKYRWPGKFVASISLDIGLHSLPRRLIESGLFSFWKRKKKKKGKEGGAREKSRGELCFARFSVFMDVVFYGGFL